MDSKPPANCKILVSVTEPHQILTASAGFCKFLDLTKEEACTRTIKQVHGLDTDCIAISNAIKEMVENKTAIAIPTFEICDSQGQTKSVKVVCRPNDPATDGCISSCYLTFESVPFDMIPRKSKTVTEESKSIQPFLSSGYRARYNFMTGLEIHQALAERVWKSCAQLNEKSWN
jgi:hypothetical protein